MGSGHPFMGSGHPFMGSGHPFSQDSTLMLQKHVALGLPRFP